MKVEMLQEIATLLANQAWVRYWLHWNQVESPWVMALEVRDNVYGPRGWEVRSVRCDDLERLHPEIEWDACDQRYYVERTW